MVPVAARGLEQHEGAEHIGLDERVRRLDAAVDVRLGREVDDGVGLGRESSTTTGSAMSPRTNV